jgi:hypothetical protein
VHGASHGLVLEQPLLPVGESGAISSLHSASRAPSQYLKNILNAVRTATISSISSRGSGLVPNLLYSPLEEEGASSILRKLLNKRCKINLCSLGKISGHLILSIKV